MHLIHNTVRFIKEYKGTSHVVTKWGEGLVTPLPHHFFLRANIFLRFIYRKLNFEEATPTFL